MRDNQRKACYRWEWAVRAKWPKCNATLTGSEIRALVVQVWNDYRPGEQPPAVRFAGRTRAYGIRHQITIPPKLWARRKMIVLHEIAHSLGPTSDGDEPWHSPKFTSLVLELWERYADVPGVEAREMAEQQKRPCVHFACAASHCSPSQEWQEWKNLEEQLLSMLRECRDNEPDKF